MKKKASLPARRRIKTRFKSPIDNRISPPTISLHPAPIPRTHSTRRQWLLPRRIRQSRRPALSRSFLQLNSHPLRSRSSRITNMSLRRLPPPRKPNFGDFLVFAMLAFGGSLCAGLVVLGALHFHILGISTFKQANDEVHYRIGSQAVWYLVTLLFCVAVYPLLWRRSFFAGIEWRASAAARHIWRLVGAAGACFVGAIVDELLIPGPANTPIDQTFRMPGAVWLLFAFGVTLAPLIEEIAYRGFLLPSLCTAYDWMVEQFTRSKPRPLGENGFPQWSLRAMAVGSVLTSIPFALMHGEQTAYSMGPFLLLVAISLVLCWVRLAVRSLAASVVVHSSYNLLLFTLMFFGTSGFRHLDKM